MMLFGTMSEAEAQCSIGDKYTSTSRVFFEADYARAMTWYLKSANQGFVPAQVSLGLLYSTLNAADENQITATNWLRKALAKETALSKEKKFLVVERIRQTSPTLKKLASEGSLDAQFELAHIHLKGYGVVKDEQAAFRMFESMAQQGHEESAACLADMLFMGQGCEKDLNKAIMWYYQAAKNHPVSFDKLKKMANKNATAQYHLGRLYFCGKGVNRNREKAAELFLSAAKNDHTSAQYRFGHMCLTGKDIANDYQTAFAMFTQASKEDFKGRATSCLAWMIEQGIGTEVDKNAAIKLYHQAAAQGDVFAQNKIQELYNEEGDENESYEPAHQIKTIDPVDLEIDEW